MLFLSNLFGSTACAWADGALALSRRLVADCLAGAISHKALLECMSCEKSRSVYLERSDTNDENPNKEREQSLFSYANDVLCVVMALAVPVGIMIVQRVLRNESTKRSSETSPLDRLKKILYKRDTAHSNRSNNVNDKNAAANARAMVQVPQPDRYESRLLNHIINPNDIEIGFKHVGGLDDIKVALYQDAVVPFTHPHLFEKSDLLQMRKGILLYGPPGTGTFTSFQPVRSCTFHVTNHAFASTSH